MIFHCLPVCWPVFPARNVGSENREIGKFGTAAQRAEYEIQLTDAAEARALLAQRVTDALQDVMVAAAQGDL